MAVFVLAELSIVRWHFGETPYNCRAPVSAAKRCFFWCRLTTEELSTEAHVSRLTFRWLTRSFHALFSRHENVFRQSHRSAAQVVDHRRPGQGARPRRGKGRQLAARQRKNHFYAARRYRRLCHCHQCRKSPAHWKKRRTEKLYELFRIRRRTQV